MQYLRLFRCHVLRYLAQHPLLGILNVATVALGVALYLAIQIANHSANRAFEASVDMVAGKAQLQVSATAGNLPDELFPKIARYPGIRRDSDRPRISDPARFSWRISRPVGDRRPD
jgi:putative ABC transport system permease protein